MITSNYPQTDWVEQDPIEIERASVGAINDCMKKSNREQGRCVNVRNFLCHAFIDLRERKL